MDNTQPVSIEDLKNILESVFKTDIVPFLWGPPGVGKSSAVRQICEKNDWDIIDLRLSLLNPVDLRGLPMLDKKKELARWLSPSFLPSPSSKRTGVLFLDEINLAPQMVQAAAYQLILDKIISTCMDRLTTPQHTSAELLGSARSFVQEYAQMIRNEYTELKTKPGLFNDQEENKRRILIQKLMRCEEMIRVSEIPDRLSFKFYS